MARCRGLHPIISDLGSRNETGEFVENTTSSMSFFLEPGRDCWGAIASLSGNSSAPVADVSTNCSLRFEIVSSSQRHLAGREIVGSTSYLHAIVLDRLGYYRGALGEQLGLIRRVHFRAE